MRRALACLVLLGLPLIGCSAHYERRPTRPVSIDERPVPVAADTVRPAERPDTTAVAEVPPESKPPAKPPMAGEKPPASTTNGDAPPPPVPVESVMTEAERKATLARIDADTTAAGAAARKCGTRKLLPDQESVLETTLSLLEQTRAALAGNELWRAESLARKARQLAASLSARLAATRTSIAALASSLLAALHSTLSYTASPSNP
jgi:hypothetical protein